MTYSYTDDPYYVKLQGETLVITKRELIITESETLITTERGIVIPDNEEATAARIEETLYSYSVTGMSIPEIDEFTRLKINELKNA